eukprot:1185895-Prorocentrum_minimum.AAC.2
MTMPMSRRTDWSSRAHPPGGTCSPARRTRRIAAPPHHPPPPPSPLPSARQPERRAAPHMSGALSWHCVPPRLELR